jgi:CHAT domain-containing protein
LGNLGIAYKALGNYGKSVQAHRQAGKLMRSLKDWQGLGQVLVNLGNTLEAVGDYDSAIVAYEQSLKLTQQVGDRRGESTAQSNLGAVLANIGESDRAIAALKSSLAISRSLNSPSEQAAALINLGSVYQGRGDRARAIELYQQSLTIARQLQHRELEAQSLGSLALAYEDAKDFDQSVALHRQSQAIAHSLNNPELEAKALNNLGHALFGAGKLTEAAAQLRAAVQLLDALRPDLNDRYRVSIFDTQLHTYSLLQQILIADNQPEAALEASEQGRARAFVELLARQQFSPASSPTPTSPIAPPAPLSIDRIRQIAQQQNATLVEYAIVPDDDFKFRGKQRASREEALLIWVVTPSGKVTFRRVDLKPLWQQNLNLRSLADAARCLNASVGCETLRQAVRGIGVQAKPGAKPNPDSADQPNPGLRKLYQLLITPIADLLPQSPDERVIFIPQESLFLVPFPALQAESGKYLIEQHTLLTAPAIQVLEITHAMARSQAHLFDSVLIVGNPKMPKLSNGISLNPLPGAEAEAKAIAQLLRASALIGTAASETQVTRSLPQATLVHLATHGLLEHGTEPLLQGLGVPGAIALAPSPTDDGLLTADEILKLRLSAQLVVLSACDTGQGRITGDGVIGLSRAFISAGVPSLVVSLWAVPDAPTAALMMQFYQALRQNPDRAAALRSAMLKTLKQYPNPVNWAAFTLIGEAQPSSK